MFGKWMNSYYYGKSGKGDYTKEDLPRTRWQLFREMLRVRLAGLSRLNLMTVAAWLPLMILIVHCLLTVFNGLALTAQYNEYLATGNMGEMTEEQVQALSQAGDLTVLMADLLYSQISLFCLWAIPCIAIIGPVKAGLAYVTRNWSRDEHAFAWADFRDAVKENWKQALGVSVISSLLPLVLYVGYQFYGQQAETSVFFLVPRMLMVVLGVVWVLGVTFMYPMLVSYKVSFGQLLKNGLMLGIARLPQTIGIRLVLLIPALLAGAVTWFTGSMLPLLILGAYYVVMGFALSRFVIASYTNAVFDKYINSRMEGVQVNRGLAEADDDEDDAADEEAENGKTE